MDEDSAKIFGLYKQRDVAEKVIRCMKEGGELREDISLCDKSVTSRSTASSKLDK